MHMYTHSQSVGPAHRKSSGSPSLRPAALKDSSKRSINSDWKIELPGEFQLAGTTVRYVRRGLWEKMSAKGPTKSPLHLMVKTSVALLCTALCHRITWL